MPSVREGLHSEACPLTAYDTTQIGEASVAVQSESAKAVAFHAGFVGEPSSNKQLNSLAKKCAKTILLDECPLWQVDKVKGGFIFR